MTYRDAARDAAVRSSATANNAADAAIRCAGRAACVAREAADAAAAADA